MNTPVFNDVDLDAEAYAVYLPTLEQKLRNAISVRDHAQEEVDEIEAKIERVRTKMKADDFTLEPPQLAPSGRMKKGEAARLISEFLRNRNGSGATIKAVMDSTKTTYTSAYRVLHNLVDTGKATEKNNVFHWLCQETDCKNEQARKSASTEPAKFDDAPS